MSNRKFTIVYQDTRTGEIHSEHGEGLTWAIAAHCVFEQHLVRDGLAEKDSTDPKEIRKLNGLCNSFQVWYAYQGHMKDLVIGNRPQGV